MAVFIHREPQLHKCLTKLRRAGGRAAFAADRVEGILAALAAGDGLQPQHLTAPIRYRFDVSGPAPLQQDVLVSQDSFHLVPVADTDADVMFRCNTGNYLLFVYGRLPLDWAMDTGRLALAGKREQALLFPTLFQGV